MPEELPVILDRTSPVPLYHQLAQQLTSAIEEGRLRPGDQFENELSLAQRLDLSRPTVRRAIAEMVNRGLLVRRRGIGTTVANEVIHRKDELTSLYEDLARSGRSPSTELLSLETEAYNERAAEALGLPADAPMVSVERLRSAGDQPLAILHNWLPQTYADLTAEELASASLYELLRRRGANLVVAQQTIGARTPGARERKLLGMSKGDALLTMSRRAYSGDGTAIEFGDHVYRADQYAFDLTVHER